MATAKHPKNIVVFSIIIIIVLNVHCYDCYLPSTNQGLLFTMKQITPEAITKRS